MIQFGKDMRCIMLLVIILLVGISSALPTTESEEKDGEGTRKILGSSVVTSVSVIMDVGNGSQTYFTDAVGKPMTKPAVATQLASPINLLNPDRYEFYTFDDSGDLVKRLMTLDEIQGIIASGDGEASNYNSQSDDIPEKKVVDVVNNVQNVLKEEMEAHKTSPETKPTFDTPDVSSTWSMILPAIFGNSGDDITPGKPVNSATAETIMIEQTTLQPAENISSPPHTEGPLNDNDSLETNKLTAQLDNIAETTEQNLPKETENSSETNAPLITVEITSTTDNGNVTNQVQDVHTSPDIKTESSSEMTLISSSTDTDQKTEVSANFFEVPLPTRRTEATTASTSPAVLTTTAEVATSKENDTTLSPATLPVSSELDTSSSIHFYEKPNLAQTTPVTESPYSETVKPQEQFSTFFLVEDSKQRPESSTKTPSYPSPFTIPAEKISTILSNLFRRTTINQLTETYPTTTENDATTYNSITKLPLQTTPALLEDKLTTIDKVILTSTETVPTTTTTKSQYREPTTSEALNDSQEDVRFSTTFEDILQESSTENVEQRIANASIASEEKQSTENLLAQPTTTEDITTSTEKLAVTELLNQLLSTTNIYQINSELALKDVTTATESDELITSTTKSDIQQQTTEEVGNLSSKPEKNVSSSTTDVNLVSSIEQLISQTINNPEAAVESVKESEKVNQMMLNSQSKPMSEIQSETATLASTLVGSTNTGLNLKTDYSEQATQSDDSSVSQIIQEPSRTTPDDYSTTESNEKLTTTSKVNDQDATVYERLTTTDKVNEFTATTNKYSTSDSGEGDRNRYEEIDLDLPTSTFNYEAKTVQPNIIETLSKLNESVFEKLPDYTTVNSLTDKTENILNTEETKYYQEIPVTTEKLSPNFVSTTNSPKEQSTKLPSKVTPKIDLTLEDSAKNITNETSSVSPQETFANNTSNNNEIVNDQATEDNEQHLNKTEITENTTKPFVILTEESSKEYPEYSSTENTDVYTKAIDEKTTIFDDVFKVTTDSQTDSATSALLSDDTGNVEESTTKVVTTQKTSEVTQPLTEKTVQPLTIRPTTTAANVEQSNSSTLHTTQKYVNIATITASPKTEKPPELKLIQNNTRITTTTSTTTIKPDTTWTLVSTVVPHKTTNSQENSKQPNSPESTSVDLVPKPLQGFGLEDSTSTLDTDVFQFTELCNELAFSLWSSVTNGISFARSVIVSPFAATSMLAMVFLGARGGTSGEMNEILKLDDMVTFNPHSIFKNVIESIEVSKKSGVATSVFVRELYSDKNKGKLLNFYKERVKQFYDGHVEEINFKEINDVIRRRTNLLVKRQTWGKIPEYLKDNHLFVRPPLAAVSANIFQTDCSEASTEGRDGELHFVVLPSIRQRKLIPIPAVVWRSGFLAGYDPGLDATAVAIGTKDQTVSTIFIIPGQQGISAPGDGLVRLEARLIESAFRQGAWSRLLRSLIPRPGLEVQIPRFSHKSVINATVALQRMGLKDLFNSNTADLKGLNGVAHELYLSDIIQVNTFTTCGEGRIDETHHAEVYPATTNRSFRRIRKIQHYHHDNKHYENGEVQEEPRDYQRAFHDPSYDPKYLNLPLQLRPRQARLPDAPRLRFDRPFLYVVRHNPTGLILHMGRFNPRLLP